MKSNYASFALKIVNLKSYSKENKIKYLNE